MTDIIELSILTGIVSTVVGGLLVEIIKSQKDRIAKATTAISASSMSILNKRWRNVLRLSAMGYCVSQVMEILLVDSMPTKTDVLLIAFWSWFALWLFVTALFGWHTDKEG